MKKTCHRSLGARDAARARKDAIARDLVNDAKMLELASKVV